MLTLEISELLEVIFSFLDRKDIYRSYTRVSHQWNAVSIYVIQKKRKCKFINISNICDNILFHLFDNNNNAEINKYCSISKL